MKQIARVNTSWMYLALGPEAAWGSSLQVYTSTQLSVLLYTATWSLYYSPPTQTPFTDSQTLVLVNTDSQEKRTTCRCAGSYLWLQSVPLLYLRIKLPRIEGQLHFSEEAVVSKPVVMPHRDLQSSCLQLRVADNILQNMRKKIMMNSATGRNPIINTDSWCLLSFSATDPQILVENRVNGVSLNARLPLALSWRIWQQVSLHIAAMKKTQWLSCVPQHEIPWKLFPFLLYYSRFLHVQPWISLSVSE